MDKVIIKNLLVRGILGIKPGERANKQDILVNVVAYADTRAAAVTDSIHDAVNYRTMTKRIIAHVEKSEDFLVEKLVNDIAAIIIREFEVERVVVRVEKPSALRFTESVGIEIERIRAD